MNINAINSQINTSDKKMIANNFDSFVKLLITQLQSQDPTSPMDTNQFTQQVVNFAIAEQEVKSNAYLEQIANSTKSKNVLHDSINYIGKHITADGQIAHLQNELAYFGFNLPQDTESLQVTILDQTGNIMLADTMHGPISSGLHSFMWDGKDNSNNLSPDGDYTIKVSAYNNANQAIPITYDITGAVDKVRNNNGKSYLAVANIPIDVDQITTIQE